MPKRISRLISKLAVAAVVMPAAAWAQTPTTLFSFSGATGSYPWGSLIEVGGVLYGTTSAGGTYDEGTVFSLTPAGAGNVVYAFGAKLNDGANPYSGVTSLGGNLYGTTPKGGTHGDGTVFKIAGNQETVLHNFAGGQDGADADGSLLAVGNVLYGTTLAGGAANAGTMFRIAPDGQESVVYAFGVSSGDGTLPNGSLVDVKGTLYGTTQSGGAFNAGTVFSITTAGVEKVLYSFTGLKDGGGPDAGLAVISTVALYGTTAAGGAQQEGVVFKITPAGAESTAYTFRGQTNGRHDGAYPNGPLAVLNGNLYGTTVTGGAFYGTIFQLKPQVGETVLYTFPVLTPDSPQYPRGPLISVGGTLYGTTSGGGTETQGTAFSLTP